MSTTRSTSPKLFPLENRESTKKSDQISTNAPINRTIDVTRTPHPLGPQRSKFSIFTSLGLSEELEITPNAPCCTSAKERTSWGNYAEGHLAGLPLRKERLGNSSQLAQKTRKCEANKRPVRSAVQLRKELGECLPQHGTSVRNALP